MSRKSSSSSEHATPTGIAPWNRGKHAIFGYYHATMAPATARASTHTHMSILRVSSSIFDMVKLLRNQESDYILVSVKSKNRKIDQ